MKLCNFNVGLNHPLFLIAGPCVIESEGMTLDVAGQLKEITSALNIPFIFKSSFDKANRSSNKTFRGFGIDEGLRILSEVKKQIGVPVLTDVHDQFQVAQVASVADVLQTPAFLCRQTDFINAVATSGRPVNIKKGQFVSGEAMKFAVDKVRLTGNNKIMLTERGTTFGYQDLVVDYRNIPIMKSHGVPVVMDCTHSLQQPNQSSGITGGNPKMIGTIARAAIAAGVDGLFIETHPDPSKALSDGANMLHLDYLEELLQQLIRIRKSL